MLARWRRYKLVKYEFNVVHREINVIQTQIYMLIHTEYIIYLYEYGNICIHTHICKQYMTL